MGIASTSRAVLVGHLTITIPAIVAFLLVVLLNLHIFGPPLLLYYILAGVTLDWQWYSIALPRWKEWAVNKGVADSEVENLAQCAGLMWPGGAAVGLFALHTTLVGACSTHFAPWLLGRWFALILPLTRMSNTALAGDYYLQHLELVSIVPALALGYVVSSYFPRLAIWAWVLPTVILVYKLLTFTDPSSSVLFSNPWSRFSYFFVIERAMPVFEPGFGGVDPIRVAQQMSVVAPFYSGLAYSIGALAARLNLLQRIFAGSPSATTVGALSQTEGMVDESPVEEAEKPS